VAFTLELDFKQSEAFLERPLVEFESLNESYPPSEYQIIIAVGYHDMNQQRQRIYEQCKDKGYTIASYVHPSVTYFDSEQIGEGSIILDHVTLQPGASVGFNSFIWSNSVVAHGSKVQSHCWIAAGSVVGGDVTIGSHCFLGVNATIGHNVELGNGTFVGANTLVSKNTDDNSTVISAEGEKIRLNSQQFMTFAKL
jgi:sugar O-acyltransferase (sialic acid O-acetyltransferase NeuD family)